MKTTVFGILSFLLLACSKEKNTYSETFFENKSGHSIIIFPFQKGTVNNSLSFELEPNEKRMVYDNNTRGLGLGVSFGRINQPMDSFVVKFDNLFSIVHYKLNLVGNNPRHYLYNSKRNIYNDSSYSYLLKDNGKYEKHAEYIYTFTVQDYVDAQ